MVDYVPMHPLVLQEVSRELESLRAALKAAVEGLRAGRDALCNARHCVESAKLHATTVPPDNALVVKYLRLPADEWPTIDGLDALIADLERAL